MSADYILRGNAIFDSIDSSPRPGFVAIQNNLIAAVGEPGDDAEWIGKRTRILELGDRLIMPSFIDAHVHFFMGAILASDHACCEIAESVSEEDCVRIIREFADSHPDEKNILGMGWFPSNWYDAPLPTKHSLDRAIPDRPVCLLCADAHTAWMNSKALEQCGITRDTRVENGKIGLLPDGEPSGLLFEADAMEPAFQMLMDFPLQEKKDIYESFIRQITKVGITSISEMSADKYTAANYENYVSLLELEKEKRLHIRMHAYTHLGGEESISMANQWMKTLSTGKLRLSGLKGFVDGVASTHTAYLLKPYADRPDSIGEGVPFCRQEDLCSEVTSANQQGFGVRLHCIGDAATRMALDAFEASMEQTPDHGCRNTIEHIETIDPADIPRFKRLQVIPSMQPYHLILDFDEKIDRMGARRCQTEWAHKSLLEAGATLAFGTDYPVVDFNPMPSLYAAVTRKDTNKEPSGRNPQECISLAEALKAYTIGAASAYHREQELGTLVAGKLADIVVLDQNLFEKESEAILDCKVTHTFMDGELVYTSEEAALEEAAIEEAPLELPQPELKHLFYAEVICERPIAVGNVDGRDLNVYPILGGYFQGKKIKGKVLPIGADWNYMSPPNIEVPNARYLLETDDGVIISIFSQGKSRFSPEQNEAYFSGVPLDPTSYYFRSNLYLETADDKYKWLNGMVLVGVYGVKENGSICFDAYYMN